MKTSLTMLVAGAALMAAPAFAADLPLKAKAPPPAAVGDWTGFYAGVNAGYNWSSGSLNTSAAPGPFNAPFNFGGESVVAATLATTSLGPNPRGFIGGGQVGYNWKFSRVWVGGFEADIQGLANQSTTASVTGTSGVPLFPLETFTSLTTVQKQVNWLGTVRARLGVLATPTLLAYATGGLAYGGVEGRTNISQTDTNIILIAPPGVTGSATTAGSFSGIRAGWTAGAGLEWMFAPNWTIKGEYLYYDLGRASWGSPDLAFNVPGVPAPFPSFSATNIASSTRFNGNIVRVGINYKFGGPVVAKY